MSNFKMAAPLTFHGLCNNSILHDQSNRKSNSPFPIEVWDFSYVNRYSFILYFRIVPIAGFHEYFNISMFTSIKSKTMQNIILWSYYLIRNYFAYKGNKASFYTNSFDEVYSWNMYFRQSPKRLVLECNEFGDLSGNVNSCIRFVYEKYQGAKCDCKKEYWL